MGIRLYLRSAGACHGSVRLLGRFGRLHAPSFRGLSRQQPELPKENQARSTITPEGRFGKRVPASPDRIAVPQLRCVLCAADEFSRG